MKNTLNYEEYGEIPWHLYRPDGLHLNQEGLLMFSNEVAMVIDRELHPDKTGIYPASMDPPLRHQKKKNTVTKFVPAYSGGL